jgi:DUF1680 family protein
MLEAPEVAAGYLVLERVWQAGDVIRVELNMQPNLIQSHPRVDATRSCLAIQRGPLVYCLETQDQLEQAGLLDVAIDPERPLRAGWSEELFGGLMLVEAEGYLLGSKSWEGQLYRPRNGSAGVETHAIRLAAIPYFAWGNRGLSSMRVWIPEARRT